ncbi:MAG TPA: tetratricopeptide repeat protein, partial [Kofleriaceae bacterium]|nr:tetratricopeptide repeat protein [Kofleriaceae bacterium]
MRSVAGLVVVALAVALATPAAAQSRRYPAAPVDKDAETAARSKLWAATLTPQRHPYQELVHAAQVALGQRTPDQTREAIARLDQAIQLLPRDPEAYRMRGDIYLEQKDWARCAADFAAADAGTRRVDEPPRALAELRKKLGLCMAHAGKLAEAEKTLAETVASGAGGGDVWMRLGEVRIAMGKLDEAIAALRSAPDGSDHPAQGLIHFLLAMAYDRGRRPADARVEASEGVRLDKQLTVLKAPPVPLVGAGE